MPKQSCTIIPLVWWNLWQPAVYVIHSQRQPGEKKYTHRIKVVYSHLYLVHSYGQCMYISYTWLSLSAIFFAKANIQDHHISTIAFPHKNCLSANIGPCVFRVIGLRVFLAHFVHFARAFALANLVMPAGATPSTSAFNHSESLKLFSYILQGSPIFDPWRFKSNLWTQSVQTYLLDCCWLSILPLETAIHVSYSNHVNRYMERKHPSTTAGATSRCRLV